jgi:hypothetical protein
MSYRSYGYTSCPAKWEEIVAPESLREDICREDLDAVFGRARAWIEADDDSGADLARVLPSQLPQSLQMVRVDSRGRLRPDRGSRIVDDEVDFDAARQPPVGQIEGEAPVSAVGGQLVEDPVLERPSRRAPLPRAKRPRRARRFTTPTSAK